MADTENPPANERTLRDEFAAKAMQGQLAGQWMGGSVPEDLAQIAYRIADAMLTERTKPDGK